MNKRQLNGAVAELLGQEKSEEIIAGILNTAKSQLTPLDLDALVVAGVIEKVGAWYRILKPDELPEDAKKKISTTSQKLTTSGEMGEVLVKFRKPPTALQRKEWESIVKRIEG